VHSNFCPISFELRRKSVNVVENRVVLVTPEVGTTVLLAFTVCTTKKCINLKSNQQMLAIKGASNTYLVLKLRCAMHRLEAVS